MLRYREFLEQIYQVAGDKPGEQRAEKARFDLSGEITSDESRRQRRFSGRGISDVAAKYRKHQRKRRAADIGDELQYGGMRKIRTLRGHGRECYRRRDENAAAGNKGNGI